MYNDRNILHDTRALYDTVTEEKREKSKMARNYDLPEISRNISKINRWMNF